MSFKELYYKIIQNQEAKLTERVLSEFVKVKSYAEKIDVIKNKIRRGEFDLQDDELWELYAISCVLDVLTLRYQPNNNADESNWLGPDLSLEHILEFIDKIGLTSKPVNYFHTFSCEIIEAIPGEKNFDIAKVFFPSIFIENLIIKRAGVQITLNPIQFNLKLVNNTSIYWEHIRKNRNFYNQSQGWGGNSQWRTCFRIDLETKENYIYNFNGNLNLNKPSSKEIDYLKDNGIKLEEAIELLKYRHFLNVSKNDNDLYPYQFRFEEEKV